MSYPHSHEGPDEWKRMARLAGACGFFTLAGALGLHWLHWPREIVWVYFGLAYVAGAYDALLEIWEKLVHERIIDVHFLMIAVAAGAAVIGKPMEGAILLFLFSASGAMEHFAEARTKKTVEALLRAAPREACRLREGSEEIIPVEKLAVDDAILVRPGTQVAADGVVRSGSSSIDESSITGENQPVFKEPGSRVFSGTLNLEGALEIRVLKTARDSTLQKILDLIHHAQSQKAPSQRFTDTFSRHYTWFVLVLTTLLFCFQFFLRQVGFDHSLYHAMTLLVVASPCALVLSIPSAILSAIAAGARQGILFKGGHAVETLAKVRCIALDKTGTLTTGNFRVTAVEASGHASVGECLQAAASLEAFSEHPLAMAIRHEAKNRNLPPLPVRNFTSHPGLGVEAEIDGAKCRVGQPALFEKLGISLPDLASAGEGTRVWIQSGGHFVRLTLTDEVRAESARAVGLLRKMGKRVVMLTGDHRAAAERVSREVGVDEVRADLQPQDKLEAIRELKGTHGSVAMVGDGVNDAPGMALSSIGIAMGARGSDAALEQADVILMNDRIGRLVEAVRLSERSLAVIKQNVAFSLGVVALLVTLAAFDEITLTLGVFGHEGSTVLVVLNSLRLLKKAD